MANADFQSFVDEVIDKNDITEVISEYAKVKRVGTRFAALCPLHNDKKSPSLSISPDKQLFHCFGCGANGDIFTFVQLIDSVDFKTAFQSLGGTYEKPTFGSNLAIQHAQKKKEERARTEEKLRKRKELNNVLIDVYRDYMKRAEPLSDVWCDCCNALQYQLYLHEILNEKRAEI